MKGIQAKLSSAINIRHIGQILFMLGMIFFTDLSFGKPPFSSKQLVEVLWTDNAYNEDRVSASDIYPTDYQASSSVLFTCSFVTSLSEFHKDIKIRFRLSFLLHENIKIRQLLFLSQFTARISFTLPSLLDL